MTPFLYPYHILFPFFIFFYFYFDDTIFCIPNQIWRQYFLYSQSHCISKFSFFIIFYSCLDDTIFYIERKKTYFLFFQYFLWAVNSIFIFHFLKSFNSNFFQIYFHLYSSKIWSFFEKNWPRSTYQRMEISIKKFHFYFSNFLIF